MDFQTIVDGFKTMTCIISVEKLPNNSYGKIRIVTGNKAYIDSIEKADNGPQMLVNKFIPNSEYQIYFPKDLNFEDFCYRCAVLKQPLHTYVHPERFDFYFNIFMLPLESDDDKLCYCTYTQELTKEADAAKMSNISQEVAADVLAACIKLHDTDSFEKNMYNVIKDIRRQCKAVYSCILLMDSNAHKCSILCEDFEGGNRKPAPKAWFSDDFYDLAVTWKDTIGGSNCLIIKNENDMEYVKEKNPVWYESMKASHIDNIVMFPIKIHDEFLGYIWATNFDASETVRIKRTLELTTFFLASEISNHQLFHRMKVLSTTDMLTGVLNRNEMNNRVDYYCNPDNGKNTSIGIIFADLNGLKMINDTKGHEAGDILLKSAAKILKRVFKGYEIFRAGGDEFMIMLPDTPPVDIENLVKKLKKETDKNGKVSFATGFSMESDCKNIRSALKHADELMYADKKRFYDEFPEKKLH